jgi:hypothetical protein
MEKIYFIFGGRQGEFDQFSVNISFLISNIFFQEKPIRVSSM